MKSLSPCLFFSTMSWVSYITKRQNMPREAYTEIWGVSNVSPYSRYYVILTKNYFWLRSGQFGESFPKIVRFRKSTPEISNQSWNKFRNQKITMASPGILKKRLAKPSSVSPVRAVDRVPPRNSMLLFSAKRAAREKLTKTTAEAANASTMMLKQGVLLNM